MELDWDRDVFQQNRRRKKKKKKKREDARRKLPSRVGLPDVWMELDHESYGKRDTYLSEPGAAAV